MLHFRKWILPVTCVVIFCGVIAVSTVLSPNAISHLERNTASTGSQTVKTTLSVTGGTVMQDPDKIPNEKPMPKLPDGKQLLQKFKDNPAVFLSLQKKYNLVKIPTYDGSYQLTHPKVLYFPNRWHGYSYWMSMTPYPHERDLYENPSIVVSNDGKNWTTPAGLKNPVTGIPQDVKAGGHYSDPQLMISGNTMELWYRYNPALPNKKHRRLPNNSANIYYRITSTDGVHWTQPEKLLEDRDGHLSLCVLKENGVYRTWYADYGGDLCYSESANGHDWSTPQYCKVPLPKGYRSYHQDMIHYGSTYYLLQTAEKVSNYSFGLFLLTSTDGFHFSNPQQLYPSKNIALWKGVSFYRSTLFVKDNKLNLYVSLVIPKLKWFMTQMTIPFPQDAKNSAKVSKAIKI